MNNCFNDNIFVFANMMHFKDDIIVKNPDAVIHSMSKNKVILDKKFMDKIKDKKYAIIIGDQVTDLLMANNLPKKEEISFGFLESNVEENKEEFNNKFDVVLTDNESFNSISELIGL